MSERDQLIENIIISEIVYNKKLELLKVEKNPQLIADYSNFLTHDDTVIAIWCANYGITKADILPKRIDVLNVQKAKVANNLSVILTALQEDTSTTEEELVVAIQKAQANAVEQTADIDTVLAVDLVFNIQ